MGFLQQSPCSVLLSPRVSSGPSGKSIIAHGLCFSVFFLWRKKMTAFVGKSLVPTAPEHGFLFSAVFFSAWFMLWREQIQQIWWSDTSAAAWFHPGFLPALWPRHSSLPWWKWTRLEWKKSWFFVPGLLIRGMIFFQEKLAFHPQLLVQLVAVNHSSGENYPRSSFSCHSLRKWWWSITPHLSLLHLLAVKWFCHVRDPELLAQNALSHWSSLFSGKWVDSWELTKFLQIPLENKKRWNVKMHWEWSVQWPLFLTLTTDISYLYLAGCLLYSPVVSLQIQGVKSSGRWIEFVWTESDVAEPWSLPRPPHRLSTQK